MSDFGKRAQKLRERAALNITDIALFCDVQKNTMWLWLNGTTPFPARIELLNAKLDQIEEALGLGLLPVPLSITQYKRREYIEGVRNAVAGKVSKPRVTGDRKSVV